MDHKTLTGRSSAPKHLTTLPIFYCIGRISLLDMQLIVYWRKTLLFQFEMAFNAIWIFLTLKGETSVFVENQILLCLLVVLHDFCCLLVFFKVYVLKIHFRKTFRLFNNPDMCLQKRYQQKILADLDCMHTWWSTQSRLATLLSSLIARRWVGLLFSLYDGSDLKTYLLMIW